METQSTQYNRGPQIEKTPPRSSNNFNGRALAGFVVVLVGSALLLKQLHVPLPWWLFSFPMLLIVIGIYAEIKSGFRGIGWLIPIAIGSFFMMDRIYFDFEFRRFFWASMIIVIGLFMILRPRRRRGLKWSEDVSSEDRFDATAVFGGVKKNVITKDFKGGEVTSIFGGSEINLSQADINGRAVLEVTTLFGGSKIIVPANWQVNSDGLTAILGALEDKRAIMANPATDSNKVLVIRGTVMFGGIEIKSF